MLVFALCRDRNERAGRELIPAVGDREAAVAPSCAPTRRTPTRCRRTTCSTRSSRATSSTTCRSPSSRRAGHDPELVRRVARHDRPQRVQAPPGRRPACGCRRRRSARIAGSRSPTAGPADSHACRHRRGRRGGRCGPSSRSSPRPRRTARTFVLVQDALERVTPVGLHPAAVRGRRGRARCRSRCARGWRRPGSRRDAAAMFVPALLAFGVVAFVGYWFQNAGSNARRRRTPRSSRACSSSSRRSSRRSCCARRPPPNVLAAVVVATVGLFLLTGADLSPELGRRCSRSAARSSSASGSTSVVVSRSATTRSC